MATRELDALRSTTREGDVADWRIEQLVDHIVSHHHTYVRNALPSIGSALAKLETVHGRRHPELAQVRWHVEQLRLDLFHHLLKEEHLLFPYLRDLARYSGDPGVVSNSPFGTVENPIRMLEREHRNAAEELRVIRQLTRDYRTPPGGCASYRACMAELAEFECDLLRHLHLEDSVLFPKAVELERAAWQE